MLAACVNGADQHVVDHWTYVLASDGDLIEGVAYEAASLAGHLGLGKLIYLYDQNQITLAATAGVSFSEEVGRRFEALGWHTLSVDGMDTDAVRLAIESAQSVTNRPSLICARTVIGFGSPKANTFGVHGSPLGPDGVRQTKEDLGWPTEPPFFVPDDTLDLFREAVARGDEAQREWQRRFVNFFIRIR